MVGGISQIQKDKYYMISLIGDTYRVVKLVEAENRMVVVGG